MQTEKLNEGKYWSFKGLKDKNCDWMKSLESIIKTDNFLEKYKFPNLYM